MTTQTALSPDPAGTIRLTVTGTATTAALTGGNAGNPWRFFTADEGLRLRIGTDAVPAEGGVTLAAGVPEVFDVPQGAQITFAGTGTVELTRLVSL